MNTPHRVGEVGVVFRATLKDQDGVLVDISAATTLELRFYGPQGQRRQVGAAFPAGEDGSQARLEGVTIAGTINEAGIWRWQAHAAGPGFDWFSDDASFVAEANF